MGLLESWRRMEKDVNETISKSIVGKYFKLEARNSSFSTEFRAGTATFIAIAYVLSISATILSDSGGACSISDCTPAQAGTGSTLKNHTSIHQGPGPDCRLQPNKGYEDCVSKIKNDMIVVTALSSLIGCFGMGILANLPLALAPGLGGNAFFVYNLVGYHGSGPMSYETALAVVFVEGCSFLAISALGLRSKLARLIPKNIRLSCMAGIGLFLAFVGLQSENGLGLVGPSDSTLVTLAACSHTNPLTGACEGGKMMSPTFWLGALGFIIMSYCLMKEIKGGMVYGILLVTLVSWIRGTSVTFFPNTPLGDTKYKYFKKVVTFHEIKTKAGALSFSSFNRSEVWVALFSLLYVDVLATTGILYSMAEFGGFLNENGGFEGEYLAFIVDSSSTIIGSTLGTSTISTYVESSVGMQQGGRTGLTAITVGFYFFLSLFFTPLMASVPPWAVGPSMVLIGVMMMRVVKDIEWLNMKEGVPAFMTMVLMPLTYSIPNGIIGGIGIYIVLNLYDWIVGWLMRKKKKRMSEQDVAQNPNTDTPSASV